MNPLLAQFIAESRDQLELTGAGLLAIESHPNDTDKINEIFRAAHTIKGSSGLFEMRPVTLLVHAAEDLLDALRSHTVSFERPMIDLLLEAFDQVNQWLDVIERTETLPEECESTARDLGARLRAFLKDVATEEAHDVTPAMTFTDLYWLDKFSETERIALFHEMADSGEPLLLFRYAPDENCFFKGEDPFYQIRQVPRLMLLDLAPTEAWPPLTEMDAYRCILQFEGVACAPLHEMATLFRYVPDQVCLLEAPPHVLAVPTGRHDENAPVEAFITEALEQIDQEDWAGLRASIAAQLESTDAGDWVASALRWMALFLENTAPEPVAMRLLVEAIRTQQGPNWISALASEAVPPSQVLAPASRAMSDVEQAAFQRIMTEQQQILGLPVEPESWTGRVDSICSTIGNSLRYAQRNDLLGELEEARERALDTGKVTALYEILSRLLDSPKEEKNALSPEEVAALSAKAEEATTDKLSIKTLKVDQYKVDRLMDLIGELVVAKNALPYVAQRAEVFYGQRELAREIKEQYNVINRIAQELQGSIMQIRMMPVGHIFQRFPRLVRDLSKKLEKRINLVVEGEDTEADKNIIETLADPLIHILRNSLDHGIELPEERLLKGKPDEGLIRVKAYQDNDTVAIEITDDGNGVNADAVKGKLVQRGLVTPEQAEVMTEHEAVQWIFAPGLSTADQVSDISGRGVGMDVVRSSINKVGGTVTVNSRRGLGTNIRLTLPLSMAVTRVMAVELEGRPFGVPMDMVVETVRLAPHQIYSIKQREAFVLRDQLVPLTRLRKLLDLETPDTEDATLATLVVKSHGESVGLVVDNFREGMEVILKPLEGVLAGLRHYTGTALLGDGSVMLIINLKELL